jgi:hypothetical protein
MGRRPTAGIKCTLWLAIWVWDVFSMSKDGSASSSYIFGDIGDGILPPPRFSKEGWRSLRTTMAGGAQDAGTVFKLNKMEWLCDRAQFW